MLVNDELHTVQRLKISDMWMGTAIFNTKE
jgi:hypothetical protein